MDGWREHEARRRAGIRERNEWTEEANVHLGSHAPTDPPAEADDYACECGCPGCQEKVGLTIPEYEAVRAEGAQFVVAVNHEDPEIEAVATKNDRFVVVRVLVRSLARIARERDPRS
ncbi:MAG TPA: hypothetical protein VGK51_07600 [Actinomycetota bacterium]|jgi:hypothetical protein